MANQLDSWLTTRREQDFKANSLGAKAVNDVKAEQESEKLNHANQRTDELFTSNKLLNKGVKKEDYNFSAMYEDLGGFGDSPDGVTMPNKYRAPLRTSVLGFDLGTGRQELKTLKDGDGIAKKAVELLRTSSASTELGRPKEDAFPLSQIAYQSLKEGKDFEAFKKGASDWDDGVLDQAWRAAETVSAADEYSAYVESGEWNTRDNPPRDLPEKFKHSETSKNPIWLNSSKYFFEKLYGPAKAGLDDESLNSSALHIMSQFNNNLTAQSMMAARVADSSDEDLKKAFYNMMLFYDNIDIDGARLEYLGRAAGSIASDPLAYLGAGVGTMLYKKIAAAKVGSRALSPILAAGISAAPEGGFYSLGLEAGKQVVEKEAGARQELDAGAMIEEGAKGAALTAAGGVALGVAAKGVGTGTNQIISRINEIKADDSFFSGPNALKAQNGSLLIRSAQGEMFDNPNQVDPFYSRLSKTIDSQIGKKGGKAEALLNRLNSFAKKGGFKAEELEWSGITDFLEANKGRTFTRDELLEVVNANNFKLEEKRLGVPQDAKNVQPLTISVDTDFKSDVLDAPEDYEHLIDEVLEDPEVYGFDSEDAKNYISENTLTNDSAEIQRLYDKQLYNFAKNNARILYMENPVRRYSSEDLNVEVIGSDSTGYQITHFGEPLPEGHQVEDLEAANEVLNQYFADDLQRQAEMEAPKVLPKWAKGEVKYPSFSLQGGENYREVLFKANGAGVVPFNREGKHYPADKNVLMHVRASDFKLANGSKTLYIDEVQSDWHNVGKQEGYKSKTYKKDLKVIDDEIETTASEIKALFSDDSLAADASKNFERISNDLKSIPAINSLGARVRSGAITPVDFLMMVAKNSSAWENIPDKFWTDYGTASKYAKAVASLALKTQDKNNLNRAVSAAPLKDDYPAAALKRMVREAVDSGYKSISWSTSEIQADRYRQAYKGLYDLVYDKKMVGEAERLAKKYGGNVEKKVMDTDDGPVEVWNLSFTPKLEYTAKYEGFPLLQAAGLGIVGAASTKEDEKNDR